MDKINAKGGVMGRPLEVFVQDDAGDPIYPAGLQFDERGRVKHPVTFIYELTPELAYKTIYVWEGEPPYSAMSVEEYDTIIKSLQ